MSSVTEQDSCRIAVDIGGTFTDLVMMRGSRPVANVKVLTTPEDPSIAVATGVSKLLEGGSAESVREIVHGTTLATNALIERKGARTALVITKGFRDVLIIRRELRYDLYDLFLDMPDPLVPRRRTWEVPERVIADGSIDIPLDLDEVRHVARQLGGDGIESVAICLLHCYKNPVHEQEIAAIFREELPDVYLSIASEVSPELGEYARTSTVVANAYVRPLIARYLEMLETKLYGLGIRGPLRIMLSTGGGGLAGVETAKRFPVRLLESGPAAGSISAGFWASQAGYEDVLAFDMGGTTAKACLIERGRPLVAREFEAARVYQQKKGSGLPLRIPVIDLIEAGAGGGSIARIGPFGLPRVGPDSTGAMPGPACYGAGGIHPTVTDADLVLGYLRPDFFLGGDMKLNPELAREAISPLALELKLSIEDTAAAIHRVVNEGMASAARMHAVERGRDIRPFALVATGGAGPVHAWGVAIGLGLNVVIYPPNAGVASAFGMLTAAPGFEFARSLPSLLSDVDWPEVRNALTAMSDEGRRQLGQAGVPTESVRVTLRVDVRYQGQGDTIPVDLGEVLGDDPARQIEGAFEATYVTLYGRKPPGVETEVMTWRARITGPAPTVDVRIRPGDVVTASTMFRDVWFAETGFTQAQVLDRYSLRPSTKILGPAVVEERESTAVIGPGGAGYVDAFGNLVVEVNRGA